MSDKPGQLSVDFTKAYGNTLAGQQFSIDQQCQFIFGPTSHFCNGVSIFFNNHLIV